MFIDLLFIIEYASVFIHSVQICLALFDVRCEG